jgi:hypothetical protein
MGHKNPDKFFNDPSETDPQTGQPLHPPAPPQPDPKSDRVRGLHGDQEQQALENAA